MRLCACLGVPLEIIEPCAFPLNDRSMKRAALDYGPLGEVIRHPSWDDFLAAPARTEGRLLLMTTKGATPYLDFSFEAGDTLLMGRESAGAPDHVHAAAQGRLVIPIRRETRSLNIATAAAMTLGEAIRQTRWSSAAAGL